MNKKSKIYYTYIVFLTLVFCFSTYKVIATAKKLNDENETFQELKNIEENSIIYENSNEVETDKNNYQELKNINKDFIGWISIFDTKIDYPVMYTPDKPNYYLNRSFDKEYSISGVPYIGDGSSIYSRNIIIHSHNMKNDTMFGQLINYKSKEYCKEHNEIIFNTDKSQNKYKVFAVLDLSIEKIINDNYIYYNSLDEATEYEYDEYISNIKENALYIADDFPKNNEQILTLSTCGDDDSRFIIIARKIDVD